MLVLLEQNLAAIVDRRDPQLRALLRAELLPRHDVGVVLEVGDDDLVALADVAPSPGLRHEVDRFGRAADAEDDLFADGALMKRAHLLARRLVGIGRARGERVRGAMDVGVLVLVEVATADR